MKKTIVLLSGGLDSTINLYEAHRTTQVLCAITFDYGQRAAEKEIESSKAQCDKLNIDHKVIDLPWFKDFTKSSLVNTTLPVPSLVALDDAEETLTSAKQVWVPNRNGILLNIAAGYAEGLGADYIIPGFNIEEAATFPDNSADYLRAINTSLNYSTSNSVCAMCFTTNLNKKQIAEKGIELGVDFSLVWSCYHDLPKPCGKCESCQRYKRATADIL